MIRQSSSAGPCKYLHIYNKKLCKIPANQRRKKNQIGCLYFRLTSKSLDNEKQFLVSQTNLLDLFKFCQKCSTSSCKASISLTPGTFIEVTYQCKFCDCNGKWRNQKMVGNLPTINLLSTVAMAVTGIMIDKSFYLFFVSIQFYFVFSSLLSKPDSKYSIPHRYTRKNDLI